MIHKITLSGYSATTDDISGVLILGTYDSYGIERVQLELGPEWNALVIKATFNPPTGSEPVTVVADTSGQLRVPQEATSSAGQGAITFVGTAAGLQRISTDLPYIVKTHSQIEGATPSPTPSEWEQFVAQVQQARDDAEAAAQAAEASQTAAASSADAAAKSAKQAAQATADIGEAKDDALEAIQQAQDTGVQAVQTATTTGVQAIQQAHQAALDDIATDRQQALTDIETEGEKQTSAITSSGAAALEAIGQVEQTAIGQVQQAGQTQQTAIEQAGQSWQQQIAAAGTAELGRWAPAIWDTAPLAAEHDIYAAEGAPLRVTQQGETQQQTTTGAQLLSDDDIHMTQMAFLAVSGLAPGEYTLSITSSADWWTGNNNRKRWFVHDGNSGDLIAYLNFADAAVGGRSSAGFSVPEGTASIIVYTYSPKTNESVTDIMLNAGSDALPWEPYTGGAPSPSPDYPQEIKGTGLDKSLTLDPDHKTGSWRFGAVGIQSQPVLRIHQPGLPLRRFDGIFCNQYMGSTSLSGALPMQDKSIFTASTYFGDYITIRDSSWASLEDAEADLRARIAAGIPCIVYWRADDGADDGTDYTVGISTEDDAGGYHGQALAIGSPLYGKGNVVDTVENDVLVDGEHKTVITRRWRMVELDGTEAWALMNGSETQNGAKLLTGQTPAATPTASNQLCTHAQLKYVWEGDGFYVSGSSLVFGASYMGNPTLDEFKAWLAAQKSAGTPVRVLYQLAKPEEYASDPHTLPALGSLPETVKATGQSTVSYSADTRHYIDSKLQAIAAQQLNLMIGGST